MQSFDIVVVGGGATAFHTLETLVPLAKKQNLTVASVQGSTFKEFAIASTIFVTDPTQYKKYAFGDLAASEFPTVKYFYHIAAGADCASKTVTLSDETVLNYKALIVATGSHVPLLNPRPGMSFDEREKELEDAYAALKSAKTVVLNGAGLIGTEFAGDLRAKMLAQNPGLQIVILARDGAVCKDLGTELSARVKKKLTDDFGIRVVAGTVAEVNGAKDTGCEPVFRPGSKLLVRSPAGGEEASTPGESLDFDVYLPMWFQRANTQFLEKCEAHGKTFFSPGDRKLIQVNECLQSVQFPEVFGAGVTSEVADKHIVGMRLAAQGRTCAKNAVILVSRGAQGVVQPHVDKEMPPPMARPFMVPLGHGKDAYLFFADFPPEMKLCCCQAGCKGGFPFCPPPCCWPCCHPMLCGMCGAPAESAEGALMINKMVPMFPGNHGYKNPGKGLGAPAQQSM